VLRHKLELQHVVNVCIHQNSLNVEVSDHVEECWSVFVKTVLIKWSHRNSYSAQIKQA
jgi:hypothetical protein